MRDERTAKLLQLAGLLCVGYIASFDVQRTMQQKPISQQQQQQLQQMLEDRKR